jgi:XRE family transcriptional regulator, aerobic/anaerobic benzoate catabolism transcriptional regulator
MTRPTDSPTEPRRGEQPQEEAYLRVVGERVRMARNRRGMTRKILSQSSGVSERYLADLERGAGNASLLVLRQISDAMGISISDLVSDKPERPIDLTLALNQLERLAPAELAEARRLLADRFRSPTRKAPTGRIALIGLRGAGKTSIGTRLAEQRGVPFIELDREIERAAGMELSEIFSMAGQATFRRLEIKCLETVVQRYDQAVIATGGSLVTEPAAFELLLSTCFVVWLKATPESHMTRVVAQGDLRPMADNPRAMDDLKEILSSRAGLYAKADAEIDTTGRDIEAAVSLLTECVGWKS